MGCDIHAFIEVKNGNGWQYYDWRKEFENGTYEDGSPSHDWKKMFDHPLYIGRNYDLFSILANVRNGRGFAGVPTGLGFKPIDMPRGLPNDTTLEVKQESEDWGIDGHSHSWLSLKELTDYDYEQTTIHFGVVHENTYRQFKETGKPPESYSGDVWGSAIVKLSPAEMDLIISGKMQREDGKEYYTTIQWPETYRQSVGEAWFNTLAELAKLGKPEDVRLVFWFDS